MTQDPIKKRNAGLKAQSMGSNWENFFFKHCLKSGIGITRIPDGCRQIASNQLVRVRSPWDFVLSYQSRTALIDTKTIDDESFPHSLLKEHQILELLHHESFGTIAGYIIYLRKVSQVFFMSATALAEFKLRKGSFDHTHHLATHLGNENFNIKLIFQTIHPLFWPKGVL